jgi:hypothetical protein
MNKNLAHFAHHFFSMQGSLPIGLKILVTPLLRGDTPPYAPPRLRDWLTALQRTVSNMKDVFKFIVICQDK